MLIACGCGYLDCSVIYHSLRLLMSIEKYMGGYPMRVHTFCVGFSEALKVPPEALPKLLQATPFQGRGFAIEGAAMALTLMDELSPGPHSRLCVLFDGRSTEEQTLGAMGYRMGKCALGQAT